MNITTFTVLGLLLFFQPAISQNQVKMHEGVKIGGIKQWIGATGDDDTKPLLLFLHGGPGFSSRGYSKKFVKLLKKDFIVAQWDQRGAGITKAWSPDAAISMDLMHSDTKEVVAYLLKKFNKEKLYLAGFSWGGFLGLHFANEHPELLHAYISVSGMISGDNSEKRTLEMIKTKAKEAGNTTALNELNRVEIPYTNWEQLYFQRKWMSFFTDGKATDRKYPRSVFESWSDPWMPIFTEASAVDYPSIVKSMDCPVYFFVSKNDWVANYSVTEEYFNLLNAEEKHIVWFNEAGHEIPSDNPSDFSEELRKILN